MNPRRVIFIALVLALLSFKAKATTYYVDLNSPNPVPPYATLATAATNIQTAVDAATNGDLVLVNDGIYQSGFRVTQEALVVGSGLVTAYCTNRLVVGKALTVQSLHGPATTFINGSGLYRCVDLTTSGAALNGFTLMNGQPGYVDSLFSQGTNGIPGGGVQGVFNGFGGITRPWVSNCVLTANMSYGCGGGAYDCHLVNCALSNNVALSGGGAYSSQLSGCWITGNSAQTNQWTISSPGPSNIDPTVGGGIYSCSATNCVIVNNTAYEGGGVYGASGLVNCTVVSNTASIIGGVGSSSGYAYNCIIYYNSAAGTNSNFAAGNLSADHCCTFPLPTTVGASITNAPVFANLSNGDFHLSSNSPCINAGNNSAITSTNDYDGNARIAGGTVDIGAYEYQSPASVLSYAWAQQYGLPVDGSMDYTNLNGTGFTVYQDWIAGLNPTNPASVLAMSSATPNKILHSIVITWQSVSTRNYLLQRSSNLSTGFTTIQSNIAGVDGTSTAYDSTATNGVPYFYRVGIQ